MGAPKSREKWSNTESAVDSGAVSGGMCVTDAGAERPDTEQQHLIYRWLSEAGVGQNVGKRRPVDRPRVYHDEDD